MKPRTKIDEMQDEAFRNMTPEERLRIAGGLYDFVKRLYAASGEKVYERVRRATPENRRRP